MSFEKLLITTTNTINLIFYSKIFYIIYKYIVRKFKIFISSIVDLMNCIKLYIWNRNNDHNNNHKENV